MAEEAEHGPDEVLLGLGLVLARRVSVEDVANLLHRLSGLPGEGPPVRTPG